MKILIIAAISVFLTACGSSGGSSAPVAEKSPSTPAVTTPGDSGSTPTPSAIQLVVYTQTMTKSNTMGGVTVPLTETGYCTVYVGKTYCWDDGWHRPFPSVGYSFWGFVEQSGSLIIGGEGMSDIPDPFTAPVLMTASFDSMQLPGNILEPDGSLSTMVTRLFAAGTTSNVSCTLNAQSNLDCGTFTLVVQ